MSMMKVVEFHVRYLIAFPSITMCSDPTVRSMRRSLSLGRRRTGSESRSAMELEEAAQVTYCSGLCLSPWQELHSKRVPKICSCSEV